MVFLNRAGKALNAYEELFTSTESATESAIDYIEMLTKRSVVLEADESVQQLTYLMQTFKQILIGYRHAGRGQARQKLFQPRD